MKKIISSCFLLLATSFLYSQGVLQGKLTFGARANAAKGYQVAIMPTTPASEQTISNPNFTGNTPSQLKQLNALVAFTNNDGMYYFRGLPAGRYLLKVCTANGYKYNFVIDNSNYKLMTIKDLPAVY